MENAAERQNYVCWSGWEYEIVNESEAFEIVKQKSLFLKRRLIGKFFEVYRNKPQTTVVDFMSDILKIAVEWSGTERTWPVKDEQMR
jgi:hypothetical protein